MVDVLLRVKRLTWPRSGVVGKGAIFLAETLDKDLNTTGKTITVRADYKAIGRESCVNDREIWRIIGSWETYKGKKQITAQQAFLFRPRGDHIVDLLTHNPRFAGLGEAYAERLWANLGTDLHDILNSGDFHALEDAMMVAEVRNAEKVARTAIEAWAEMGYGEVVSWLDSLRAGEKMGVRMGRKIYECWGDKAKEIVTADPYRLVAFTNSYEKKKDNKKRKGWKLVDGIARSVFMIPPDDVRRQHAAIVDSLFCQYDEKSTIVDRDTLFDELKKRLGNEKLAERTLKENFASRAFLTNDRFWQARGAFLMEKAVAEGLAALAQIKQYELFGENAANKERIRGVIREFEGEEGYDLGDEQKKAVELALENQVSVITGGAGVGKTSVLTCLHKCIEDAGGRVIQMALSGRASRRMATTTKRHAITIAGFLSKEQDFDGKPTIIIDEASMLDLPLTYRIVKKVPLGCRLVFVGDAEQLSPIGPGKVFHLLTKDFRGIFPTVELTKVYRQDGATGIPAVADAIRRSEWPELPEFDGQKGVGVSVIPAPGSALLGSFDKEGKYQNGILEDLYEKLGGNSEEDVQILSATRGEDSCGTVGINEAFHEKYALGCRKALVWYNHVDDFLERWIDSGFSEGDKVMFTYNDWDRDLFNGSLGVVTNAYGSTSDPAPETDSPRMEVDFDTGAQELNAEDLDSCELAYSITVHKAQGSQFERVIIPIRKGNLLDRSLIYTAITRGVKQVVLVGDIEAAANAVRSEAHADKRQVGLGHLLKLEVHSYSRNAFDQPHAQGS